MLLALALLKPHVTYLVWVALILWCARHATWRLWGGLAAAVVIAWVIPTLTNAQVTAHYVEAVRTAPPLYWLTATIGSYLRDLLGWERQWLQFVPSVAGLCWFAWYWRMHADTWSWSDELPLLLLVSASTMAFGWPFDFVVLVPAVIQVAVWALEASTLVLRTALIVLYVVVNALAIWQAQSGADLHHFVWIAPACLLVFVWVRSSHPRRTVKSLA
jgi:hypothetical protein